MNSGTNLVSKSWTWAPSPSDSSGPPPAAKSRPKTTARRCRFSRTSDADAAHKEKFLRKAKRILADEEMLMEAKDDGETVRIYGLSNAAGNILEDIIILAGDALISVRGKIRADLVGELVNQAEK